MRRFLRWSLALVGTAGVVALAFFCDSYGAMLGCGRVPARVRGVVLDATKGAPIEGAFLLTLRDPKTARNSEALESWRARLRWREGSTRDDLIRFPTGVGSARTDAAGAFEIVVALATSRYRGSLGLCRTYYRESASDVARALLVEKDGYLPLVHETRDARWEERLEGRIVGTLDVGTIRLNR